MLKHIFYPIQLGLICLIALYSYGLRAIDIDDDGLFGLDDSSQNSLEDDDGLFGLDDSSQNSSEVEVYVTHLSFMDANTKTPILDDIAILIDKAVVDGMQLAKNASPHLEINYPGYKLENIDANVNKFVNIFWDVNLSKAEKIQKIITEMMEPVQIDVIVTGQYLEKMHDVISVRTFIISKSKNSIVSRHWIFDNKQFLCTDRQNYSVKVLCQEAHKKIRDSVKELLELLDKKEIVPLDQNEKKDQNNVGTKNLPIVHHFKFPSKIQYDIFVNGIKKADSDFSVSPKRMSSGIPMYQLSFGNFQGLGLTSRNKIYTIIFKDTLSLSRTMLMQGRKKVYEMKAKPVQRIFDDEVTDVFLYLDESLTKPIETELYIPYKIIDLLSLFLIASESVASGKTAQKFCLLHNSNFLVNRSTEVVQLKQVGKAFVFYQGQQVQTTEVALIYQGMEAFKLHIYRDKNGLYFPVRFSIDDEQKGLIELRAAKAF